MRRKCKICARTRKHEIDEIVDKIQSLAQNHDFAEHIGEQVYLALIQEARLSPKPGLVDAINNGSHKDMNLHTFEQSAISLKPFLRSLFSKA